jgi:hypothetical protein
MKSYRSTPKLVQNYNGGKYKVGSQRHCVVRALVESKSPRTLDDLFDELNDWPYWSTVKHKDRNGKPSRDSWLILEAGGIRRSIKYHLDALEKTALIAS